MCDVKKVILVGYPVSLPPLSFRVNMQHTDVGDASPKSIVFTVFIALVLDLLAFTIPLPLFPRLIAWYLHRESHSPDTLLSRSLHLTHSWRARLLFISDQSTGNGSRHEKRWLRSVGGEGDGNRNWDVVLLGGAMGSLFSLCQCVISPWLGRCECSPLVSDPEAVLTSEC